MARHRGMTISVGALALGLVTGSVLAFSTGGGGNASAKAPATTTTSTTSTTTTSTSTTTTTLPSPSILEFTATPTSTTCTRVERLTRIVVAWSTQATQSVTISADGLARVVSAPSTGSTRLSFSCPSPDTADQHRLWLTTIGVDGTSARASPVSVSVFGASANSVPTTQETPTTTPRENGKGSSGNND